jgi:hypothetical protein
VKGDEELISDDGSIDGVINKGEEENIHYERSEEENDENRKQARSHLDKQKSFTDIS